VYTFYFFIGIDDTHAHSKLIVSHLFFVGRPKVLLFYEKVLDLR